MNVLVTGASRGIGRAISLAFADAGHNVAVNYERNREAAEGVVRDIRAKGVEGLAARADVSDSAQADRLVQDALDHWGRLDVLVNNAGVTRDRSILKMSDEEWRRVVDVNLNGAFWVLRAAAKAMSRQKGGAILNTASIMALKGGQGCANYSAAKAGLVALTKSAARELGRFNIRVNAFLPGYHPTDMNSSMAPELVEKIKSEHTLGRFPDMGELARFVVGLSSLTSVSGQVFNFESRIL